jgi:hypothetical protein
MCLRAAEETQPLWEDGRADRCAATGGPRHADLSAGTARSGSAGCSRRACGRGGLGRSGACSRGSLGWQRSTSVGNLSAEPPPKIEWPTVSSLPRHRQGWSATESAPRPDRGRANAAPNTTSAMPC